MFTGWDAKCVMVYQDRLFFGSTGGKVIEAMVSGFDQGQPYTATCVPLFETMRAPGRLKVPTQARAVLRAPVDVNPTIKMQTDLNISLQAAPAATAVPPGVDLWHRAGSGHGTCDLGRRSCQPRPPASDGSRSAVPATVWPRRSA